MLSLLSALVAAPFTTGAYGMPELCQRLTACTGVTHTAEAALRDYPVFVSVKSGDPNRVRSLVAAALRAHWSKEAGKLRLVADHVPMDADLPEFERQLRLLPAPKIRLSDFPIKDLYALAPGEAMRYGYPVGQYLRPLPPKLEKAVQTSATHVGEVLIRRMGYGLFEVASQITGETDGPFNDGGQSQFASLPDPVVSTLGKDAEAIALNAEQRQAIGEIGRKPSMLNIDWRSLDKRDPIAALADKVLPGVAAKVSADLIVALPDLVLLPLGNGGDRPMSVSSVLKPLAMAVNWKVVDGAIVGQLPALERKAPSQVSRPVLSKFVVAVGTDGVLGSATLAEYLAAQRPGASDSWMDAMMLIMAGTAIDDVHVGDYPHNVRFAGALTAEDWRRLRSGQSMTVADLSLAAQRALETLLLQARSRLDLTKGDPALWPSLMPGDLALRAKISEEKVLVMHAGFGSRIDTIEGSATSYDHVLKSNGEPLYQPAARRRIELTIASKEGNEVETGFSEVVLDSNTKPVAWKSLPPEAARTFSDALQKYRTTSPSTGSVSPLNNEP